MMHYKTYKPFIFSLALVGGLFSATAHEVSGTLQQTHLASLEPSPTKTVTLSYDRSAVERITVSPNQLPYTAIGHFDLEGQEAATLEFGPSSSQVAITAAHVLNTIVYGPDRHASYSDDRGNKANIVAIYLPRNYDAQDPETHGKFADKAIVVLDRPIPSVSHLPFSPVESWGGFSCRTEQGGEKDCALKNPHPVDQAGYPADRIHMTANVGGAITGILYAYGDEDIYLLEHSMRIIPGDSGSAAWNAKGVFGIVQSTLYVTPITQDFVDCYNQIVREVEASPPQPVSGNAPIRIARADM